MKKIIPLLCLLLCTQWCFAQIDKAAALIHKFSEYKDENVKVDSLIDYVFDTSYTNNPRASLALGEIILKQALKSNDIITQSFSNCMIAGAYRSLGKSAKSLYYHQIACDLADKKGNSKLLSWCKNSIGNLYKDRENWKEALKLYLSSLKYGETGNNQKTIIGANMNLGFVYLNLNQLDSALVFSQNAYELSLKTNNYGSISYILSNLGIIHTKLGNLQLGQTYCAMAIENAEKKKLARLTILSYIAMAEHYFIRNQKDSCLFYAKKALRYMQNSSFFTLSIKPAKMIAEIYEKSNCDSTLKYAKIFQVANDSFFSKMANEQMQDLTESANIRSMELATEKEKEEIHQKQNIQFALIALGIIVFITLYLLLSRSFITSTQVIEFFGVMALLIIFEFLNLLLHPFLEEITNHTPLIMLLVLVCLAAILIPLHHKLEKWATNRLITKNKEVRLANAKKTIDKLGDEVN